MQAIREIKDVHDHKVTIDVPDSFTSEQVEVIVIPYRGDENDQPFKRSADDTNIMQAQQTSMQDWDNEDDEVWNNATTL